MDRRTLLHTSAGLILSGLLPGIWSCSNPVLKQQAERYAFRPYRTGQTLGPTHIVTPPGRYFTNTYYNYNPWSPGGRYLALTELPYQDRVTKLGDIAYVVVIDLAAQRIRRVYPTRSWGYQYGALVQWGADDRTLYCNDVNGAGRAVGVRLDLTGNETFVTEGPLMDVDPARNIAIGPTLEYLNATQYSYGPPATGGEAGPMATLPPAASSEEGIWQTDLHTGKRTLLLPATELAAASTQEDQLGQYAHYVFSCRFSPDYRRIGIVQRRAWEDQQGKIHRNPSLLSYELATGRVQEAVSTQHWNMGSHHPTWHPDSTHFTMNMTPQWLGDDKLRFVQFRYDGGDFRVLSDSILGSGHPSIRPGGRYLLSDAYPFEPLAVGNGEIPIRLIDLEQQREHTVASIFTDLGQQYAIRRYWGPSKLDAHPTWNAAFDQVCFNGAPTGERAVLITDLTEFF
ncbi:hypothetical protein [Neolewinella sp.]|uniref:hypothetical protein n=1 Tax=Neolewinella sp. TaxID=2993543 RepID=UPI003B528D6E